MIKKNFKVIILVLLLFLSLFVYKDIKSDNGDTDQELNVSLIRANYMYDVNSLSERAEVVDYIFVGEVKSIDGYSYKNPILFETKDGIKMIDYDTYTNYKIYVEESIKGDLKEGEEINIRKKGGLQQDGKTIEIIENDVLPEVSYKYLFFAFLQEDGSILVSGPNTNININEINIDETESEIQKALEDGIDD